jgi:hypothetical protein
MENLTATSNGHIVAILENDRIVVEDVEEACKYTVSANDLGRNELGKVTETTWGEALREGRLIIQNDNTDGHSWGAHGSIFVDEL